MFNLPHSKFDGLASDAQIFKEIAEDIANQVENVQRQANKAVLIFIAGGLIDMAESMNEYIDDEVQKN